MRRGPSNLLLAFAVLVAPRLANLPRPYDLADAAGSLGGEALMVLWAEKGWGSVRRAPGEPAQDRGE